MHALMNFLHVVQRERDLIRPSIQFERFLAEDEEAFFTHLGFVISGRHISERESPGTVGLGPVDMPSGFFELNLSPPDWNPVLVQHDS